MVVQNQEDLALSGAAGMLDYVVQIVAEDVFIDPPGLPVDPTSEPLMKCSLHLTLGKINIDGIEFPVALTAQTSVTSCPPSPDVTEPTCFLPLSVTILPGFYSNTVVTP